MDKNALLRMLFASAVRHGLTVLSAYLISKHVALPDDFVGNMTNYAVDILPAAIAVVWSFIQKSESHGALTEAKAATSAALALPVAPVAPSVVVVETPAK